jgi:hypothetical protein
MTRKPNKRAKKAGKSRTAKATSSPRTKHDQLDAFIGAAVRTLDLPAKKAWLPAIKANLSVTLKHAATVATFELPDEAEPAPVFRA